MVLRCETTTKSAGITSSATTAIKSVRFYSIMNTNSCVLTYLRPMEQIESTTTEIAIAYEPDYEIDDPMFAEPFVVLKPITHTGRPPWWGNKNKVLAIINAYKSDFTNSEACVEAGITFQQLTYFCKIHPHFLAVKTRLKKAVVIIAKRGIVHDVALLAGFKSRQWYLERKQPHIYGRDIGAYSPPPADATAKITAEAFLNKDGKIIASRQAAELLKKEHGNSGTP